MNRSPSPRAGPRLCPSALPKTPRSRPPRLPGASLLLQVPSLSACPGPLAPPIQNTNALKALPTEKKKGQKPARWAWEPSPLHPPSSPSSLGVTVLSVTDTSVLISSPPPPQLLQPTLHVTSAQNGAAEPRPPDSRDPPGLSPLTSSAAPPHSRNTDARRHPC